MARILFNHFTAAPDKVTGITVYTWKILEALGRHGRHDYVLATNWSEEKLPAFVRELGIEVMARPSPLNETLAVIRNTFVLPALVRKHGCEAVFHPQPTAMLARMRHSVVVLHDLYRVTHPDMFKLRQRLQWQHATARGFRKAGRLIAVSQATKDALSDAYHEIRDRIVVVHEASPIEPLAYPPPPPPVEEPYGLVVANITATKNIDLLVAALERLAERKQFPRIVLVGRGESDALDRVQANPSIKLTRLSNLSDDDLRSYYFHARAFINTSLVEGFCLPILEAQTMNVPVICSDLPVLHEVAGQGARFIDPRDPADLASAITELFDDDDLSSDLRRRASENVGRFSWAKAAMETEAVIDDVLVGVRS